MPKAVGAGDLAGEFGFKVVDGGGASFDFGNDLVLFGEGRKWEFDFLESTRPEVGDVIGPLGDLLKTSSVEVCAEDNEGVRWQDRIVSAIPDQGVLEAASLNFIAIHCWASYPLEALAFVEKNVSVFEFVDFELVRREVHLVDVCCVDPVFVDVRYPEIGANVIAGHLFWASLSAEFYFARLLNACPCPG